MRFRRPGNLSLRWKMILGSVAAVTVPCLIVGGILSEMLSRSLLQVYKERSVQTARDIAALVDTTLRQELYFVTTLSFDPVFVGAVETGDYAGASRKPAAPAERPEISRADSILPGGTQRVLTDNLMPHMGGIEMARKARSLRRDIPVVLCSGYFSQDAEAEAGAVGIEQMLTKPLSLYQLAAAIRTALDTRGGA